MTAQRFAHASPIGSYVPALAFATTVIPGAVAFWGGRYFLLVAGIKIVKD